MRHIDSLKRLLLSAILIAFVAGPVWAHDYKVGALQIGHPWSRVTPKGATVAGGYLKITNTGTASDRLVGGSATISGRFEIHEMKVVSGVMQMRPLPNGLEIKPGQTVELKPGSFHLMFMELKQPVEKNKRFKGTLVFEKAGTVEVEYSIEAIGAPPSGRHSH